MNESASRFGPVVAVMGLIAGICEATIILFASSEDPQAMLAAGRGATDG